MTAKDRMHPRSVGSSLDSIRDKERDAPAPTSGRASDVVPRQDGSSDVDLVRAMAEGDRESLGSLYDRYAGLLLAIVGRVLGRGRERDAEDVVHDVFLEAWHRASAFDAERGSVRAWLVMRARSRAIDRQRRVGSPRAVSFGAAHDRADPSSEGAAELRTDRAAVQRVMATLPDEQRMVLLLAYYEGLSTTEIAARHGIAVGTVKSRAAAALAKMRAALADLEVEPSQ